MKIIAITELYLHSVLLSLWSVTNMLNALLSLFFWLNCLHQCLPARSLLLLFVLGQLIRGRRWTRWQECVERAVSTNWDPGIMFCDDAPRGQKLKRAIHFWRKSKSHCEAVTVIRVCTHTEKPADLPTYTLYAHRLLSEHFLCCSRFIEPGHTFPQSHLPLLFVWLRLHPVLMG